MSMSEQMYEHGEAREPSQQCGLRSQQISERCERTDEQMAQYSTRLFLNRSTHGAVCSSAIAKYYLEKIRRLFESRVMMDDDNSLQKFKATSLQC